MKCPFIQYFLFAKSPVELLFMFSVVLKRHKMPSTCGQLDSCVTAPKGCTLNDFCAEAGEVCPPNSPLVINHDALCLQVEAKKPKPLSPNGKQVERLTSSELDYAMLLKLNDNQFTSKIKSDIIAFILVYKNISKFMFTISFNEITFKLTENCKTQLQPVTYISHSKVMPPQILCRIYYGIKINRNLCARLPLGIVVALNNRVRS